MSLLSFSNIARYSALLLMGMISPLLPVHGAGEVTDPSAAANLFKPRVVFPPAGTRISNQASASFYFGPQPVRITSNIVRVAIAAVPGVVLQNSQTLSATPGGNVIYAHTLWNTGNSPSNYSLQIASQSGDFTLQNLRLVRDLNSNGRFDAGEPPLSASEIIPLNAGDSFPLLVVGTVPDSAQTGQSAGLQLTARGQLAPLINPLPGNSEGVAPEVTATNIDVARVEVGSILALTKSASKTSAKSGDEVRFTLQAQSTGNSAPLPIPVIVDGQPTSLVVLRDPIPANTTFQRITGPVPGRALYHRIGDPFHTYSSTPTGTVDAVAWGISFFEPRTTWRVDIDVLINSNASIDINNVARIFALNPSGSGPLETDSNTVRITLPSLPPTLFYYRNADYAQKLSVTTVGRPLYLQGDAANCNQDSSLAETANLSVRSQATGDVVNVIAVETGPNTGVFRVFRPIPTNGEAANSSDDILQIRRNDVLDARLVGCSTVDAIATILIDPLGVVFDSRTGAPVLGATVTLINATTNQPASVLNFDAITPAPSTVTTGPNGEFQFPLVTAGSYRLLVTAPQGYAFPSNFGPSLLPAGRTVLVPGSYGGVFQVSEETGAVTVDVPLDPGVQTGLFVEKIATQTRIERGDSLDYRVTVRNVLQVPMTGAVVRDVLPKGFSFVSGTARRGGVPIPDPIKRGRELTFELGTLVAAADTVLTYRVNVSSAAPEGIARNSAVASATSTLGPQNSNTAVASVRVSGGVFSTRGIILGRVYLDENGNRQYDKGELPVAGARVLIEDGTFAITDKNGQWSLYGLRATTHVVKLDRSSLPVGFETQALTSFGAGRGDSTFADLKNAELLQVNFALKNASPELKGELQKRLQLAGALEDELAARIAANLPVSSKLSDNLPSTNAIATGFVGAGTNGNSPAVKTAPLLPTNSTSTSSPSVSTKAAKLEDALAGFTGGLEFLNLREGQILGGSQTPVQVGFSSGARVELLVNGDEIAANRVGFKSDDAARGVTGWEWIGVNLKAGKNTLTARQFDAFGIARGEKSVTIVVPGRPAKVVVEPLAPGLMADGKTPVEFRFSLVDEAGIAVREDAPLTLDASAGVWSVRDQIESEAGVQTQLKSGTGSFSLIAPFEPGLVKVRIVAGALVWEDTISFAPFLRPLVAAGLTELGVSGRVSGGNPLPLGAFEDALPKIGGDVAGRGAFFLKGRVQGKYLLTLRYDSSSENLKRLFRDIQPDEYYPIYGDASLKGFDAQSTQKLYVRVDSGNSFALWGDFTTQSFGAGRSLGRYGRSLTGAQTHYENERVSATAFFAQNSTLREVREIRPNGTSGPYAISGGTDTVRLNSEKVELVIRDRDNPGRIIKTIALTRFLDYSLDGFVGGLLFKNPLLQFDLEGNPQFIRVTFEREAGGARTPVYGLGAQFKAGKNLQLGAAIVRDKAPDAAFTLGAANLALKLDESTAFTAEVARSERDGVRGNAHRIEISRETPRLNARLFSGAASIGFQNEEAVLTQGRSETGLSAAYKATNKLSFLAEAIRTRDKVQNQTLLGSQIGASYEASKTLQFGAGLRHARGDIGAGAPVDGSSPANGETSFTSAWARANYSLASARAANIFARYEQQLSGGNRSFAIGGDYQVMPFAKIYATHEFFDSPLSLNALGDTARRYGTRVGVESSILRSGSLYSEYRVGTDLDARSSQAAFGLRNTFRIGDGINLSTAFERTKELAGASTGGDGTSAALGLESVVRPDLKWNTRLEGRRSDGSDTILASGGIAYAATQTWSGVARAVYSKSNGGAALSTRSSRVQLGAAYRPEHSDRLIGLFKYEFRDDNSPLGALNGLNLSSSRRAHILVADGSYRVTNSLQARLHYAFKDSRESFDGVSSSTRAHYLGGRFTQELGNRWNASVLGARWWGNGARQSALGVEAGYVLSDNLLLSMGYNFSSINDRDLQSDRFGRGLYMRVRFKFDEDLFGGLKVFRAPAKADNAKTFEPLFEGAGGVTFEGAKSAGLGNYSGDNRFNSD